MPDTLHARVQRNGTIDPSTADDFILAGYRVDALGAPVGADGGVRLFDAVPDLRDETAVTVQTADVTTGSILYFDGTVLKQAALGLFPFEPERDPAPAELVLTSNQIALDGNNAPATYHCAPTGNYTFNAITNPSPGDSFVVIVEPTSGTAVPSFAGTSWRFMGFVPADVPAGKVVEYAVFIRSATVHQVYAIWQEVP